MWFKIQQNVIIRPTPGRQSRKEDNINIPSRSSEQGAIAFKAFLIKKSIEDQINIVEGEWKSVRRAIMSVINDLKCTVLSLRNNIELEKCAFKNDQHSDFEVSQTFACTLFSHEEMYRKVLFSFLDISMFKWRKKYKLSHLSKQQSVHFHYLQVTMKKTKFNHWRSRERQSGNSTIRWMNMV